MDNDVYYDDKVSKINQGNHDATEVTLAQQGEMIKADHLKATDHKSLGLSSKSPSQNSASLSSAEEKPGGRLTINLYTATASTVNKDHVGINDEAISNALQEGCVDKEPESPAQKILLSWEDVNRRARIFESCQVKSPNITEQTSPVFNMANKNWRINDTLEEMKRDSGEKYDSISRQQSASDPFQFPHRPIEQITLLNSEVELERQSTKRKQSMKLNASAEDVNAAFELNDECQPAKRRPPSPPEFHKLTFEGENVSGVWYDKIFVFVYR